VRITSIYEGTSEIQQSIIAMYRWKETVRSKGAFYRNQAEELTALEKSNPSVGAGMVAAAITGLNDVVLHMHAARQTRNQIVMFTFADMMTTCEVAAALCRKAADMATAGDPEAEHFADMSRVMARKAVRAVSEGARSCAVGLAEVEDAAAVAAGQALFDAVEARLPLSLTAGLWRDMVAVGETLKHLD